MNESRQQNYCSTCGVSLNPLSFIHVERVCKQCGKNIYVREAGANGKGLNVVEGDKVQIPAELLKMSLKPTAWSQLFKPGVGFLVQEFIFDGAPKSYEDLASLFDRYDNVAKVKLKKSEKVTGLDLENDDDSEKIYELLEKDKTTWEWWAYLIGAFSYTGREAIRNNEVEKAAYACFMAGQCHSMLIFKEELEDLVWKGYLAEKVVYNAAAATAQTPAEVEAIERLRPLFEKLSDDVLYAWAHSEDPIKPKIGLQVLSESLVRALVQFHLAARDRRRDEDQERREHERAMSNLRVSWFFAGMTTVGGVIAVARWLGWL